MRKYLWLLLILGVAAILYAQINIPGNTGGGTVTTGPAFLWAVPSYTSSGSGASISPTGAAHSGLSFLWNANVTTFKHFNVSITTAGSAGNAIMIGIFNATGTTPVCVSSAFTTVTSTGAVALPVATGSGVSGGVCTLTFGTSYEVVFTSDSGTIALMSYGDTSYNPITQVNETCPSSTCLDSSYTAGNNLSTGTGASLAITTPSTLTFSTYTGGSNNRFVVYLDTK